MIFFTKSTKYARCNFVGNAGFGRCFLHFLFFSDSGGDDRHTFIYVIVYIYI